MEKFLSRKFLQAVLIILAVILKHAFGIELTDSFIEYVVDAIIVIATYFGYVKHETQIDLQRMTLPQDGADLR